MPHSASSLTKAQHRATAEVTSHYFVPPFHHHRFRIQSLYFFLFFFFFFQRRPPVSALLQGHCPVRLFFDADPFPVKVRFFLLFQRNGRPESRSFSLFLFPLKEEASLCFIFFNFFFLVTPTSLLFCRTNLECQKKKKRKGKCSCWPSFDFKEWR